MDVSRLVRKNFPVSSPFIGAHRLEDKLLADSFLVLLEKDSYRGILTPNDILKSPHTLAIDCLHKKPLVGSSQGIDSTLKSMKKAGSAVLPVYKDNSFVGVITLADIADYLLECKNNLKQEICKCTAQLRETNRSLKTETAERIRTEAELRESKEVINKNEVKYRSLFENSSIPFWEEDYSEIRKRIEGHKRSGVTDFRIFFEAHPEELALCSKMVRIIDVNKETLRLFGSTDKETIRQNLTKCWNQESWGTFRETLIAIAEDKVNFYAESSLDDLSGNKMYIDFYWMVVPGHEKTYDEMMFSVIDITNKKRMEKRLLTHQAKLRSLASELTLTETRERRRIASDLHDRIGQALFIAKMKLDSLGQNISETKIGQAIEEISGLIKQTMQDVSSLVFEISPPMLYEQGLGVALRWLGEKVEIEHKIRVKVQDDGRSNLLEDSLLAILFRAARELVLNVVKHAKAENITICLDRVGNCIQLCIEDDGVGFDSVAFDRSAIKMGGFGLFSIQERLKILNGQLRLNSVPDKGTRVTLVIPLATERQQKV